MNRNLSGLRIGYIPYSETFERPGDRRRFCYYAAKRNIRFEIAKPDEVYDVLIATQKADLSVWSDYHRGNAKVIYDLADSYLTASRLDLKNLFRGLAKFVARQSRYLRLSHWKAIQTMCRRANAVICCTDEQQKEASQFCPNVHIILDFQTSVIRSGKTNYSSGEVFNFVWEGVPGNLNSFRAIRSVLERLKTKHKWAMHIVTDYEYHQYLGQYRRRRTRDMARCLFDNSYLYEWNEQMASVIISACDMALIPIPMDDSLSAGKPANKLLLFWRMGVPVVVSAIPAYASMMKRAGLPMACRTPQEWEDTLERYIRDPAARKEAGQRGKDFAEEYYGEKQILALWDDLLNSVLSR